MNIGSQGALLLIFLIPVIWLFYLRARERSRSEQEALFDRSTLQRLTGGRAELSAARPTLLLLSIFFAVIALARPQFGYEEVIQRREGLDVVFLVDVSKSMLAADLTPSRLDRVRFLILDLLSELKGDRISLVTFAGVSFRETPLTYDYASFKMFVDALSPELIPVSGTNLEMALDEALSVFRLPDGNFPVGREMVILLFSDGEQLSGDYRGALARVKEAGARIFTVGTGSATGAPIPEGGSYKRDAKGRVVLSRLDEKVLRELAESTGGRYQGESLTGESFKRYFREVIQLPLKGTVEAGGVTKVWGEYYQLPLFISMLCLMGARLAGIFSLIFVVQVCVSLPAQAESPAEQLLRQGEFAEALKNFKSASGSEQRLRFGEGIALYRLGKFADAAKSFAKAAESDDGALKGEALYNMGNSLTQLKLYKEAVEKFEQAKKLLPNDREVAENLEYVKKLLPPESSDGSGQGDGGGGGEDKSQGQENKSEQSQQDQSKQEEREEEQEKKNSSESNKQQHSSSLNNLAEAVEEDRGELTRYRQKKALEDLKKAGADLPEQDW
jgi:Ca-activated chloride channel family protein